MNWYDESGGTKRLRLPVRCVDGQWEFYLGGPVPVRDGAFGELLVSSHQISDPSFLERVTQQVRVRILGEGGRLMVALSLVDPSLGKGAAVKIDVLPEYLPSASPTFVPVELGAFRGPPRSPTEPPLEGGLWMTINGLQETEISSGPVLLPNALGGDQALSLNHAFTLLSERLETHRISHTGNVYARVFYCESNGKWYPLEVLRTRELSRAENRVMAGAWAEIEQALGWCPLPAKSEGKRRRGRS